MNYIAIMLYRAVLWDVFLQKGWNKNAAAKIDFKRSGKRSLEILNITDHILSSFTSSNKMARANILQFQLSNWKIMAIIHFFYL